MAKVLSLGNNGELVETKGIAASAGVSDAGKLPELDAGGKLDLSMMPTGIGADTLTFTASESLAAGDFVNIYYSGGNKYVRKALATDNTKPAHGFVKSAFSASQAALVYVRGLNDKVALGSFTDGDIGKKVFLSPSTAGAVTLTRPTGASQIVHVLGDVDGIGPTVTVNFSVSNFVVLA